MKAHEVKPGDYVTRASWRGYLCLKVESVTDWTVTLITAKGHREIIRHGIYWTLDDGLAHYFPALPETVKKFLRECA